MIPSRLVTSWDRREYPVSTSSKSHILSNATKPLINIGVLDLDIYQRDTCLNQIRVMIVKIKK